MIESDQIGWMTSRPLTAALSRHRESNEALYARSVGSLELRVARSREQQPPSVLLLRRARGYGHF